MGPRTFLTMWSFLWYNYFAIYGLSGSMVGLMETSFKRAYATPKSAAPRALPLQQGTADLYLCRRHSNTQRQAWLSLCGVSGSRCAQVLSEPSKHLWQVWGLILNVISALLPSCWDFFALGCVISFLGGTQHSPVDGCSVVSCNFGILAGEDEHTSFYSAILRLYQSPSPMVW